jgi:hypothetical protein
MICVSVEVREGPVTRRVRIGAPSIERALKMAGNGTPGCSVRIVSPIEPEAFFAPENTVRREAA